MQLNTFEIYKIKKKIEHNLPSKYTYLARLNHDIQFFYNFKEIQYSMSKLNYEEFPKVGYMLLKFYFVVSFHLINV